ncbi:hypothetical protein MVES1_002833 [Malassezia vespertilionis]|nr:uncharacterized protein MVES1_002833 [Malassezia vespertilionis]WFD07467.1 hypothetical protein MVES1_002833 [Malassezia vespertilionis]
MPRSPGICVDEASTEPRARPATGIYREDAPRRITLSPLKFVPSMHPSPTMHGAGSATHSPLLAWANELPDDPERASAAVHLYPHSLAPAWSPSGTAPATFVGKRSDLSPYFPAAGATPMRQSASHMGVGMSANLSGGGPVPQTPSRLAPHAVASPLRASPEPSIFERDIEHPHLRSPQEAIDVAVPPVLDDAASAIVDDTASLEIIAPQTLPGSPYVSPRLSCARPQGRTRPRNLSATDARFASPQDDRFAQQHSGRQHGHRRPPSDANSVFSMHPPTPVHLSTADTLVAPSLSPSLSIDGAIIPESNAATRGHSLDVLADAFAHLSNAPNTHRVLTPAPAPAVSPSQLGMANSSSYFSLPPQDESTMARTPGHRPAVQPLHSPSFCYAVLPMHDEMSSKRAGATHPRTSSTPLPSTTAHRHSLARHTVPVPVAGTRATPRSQDPFALKVPLTSGAGSPSGERKRLSFMAYADIINDSSAQLLDLDESVQLQAQRGTPEQPLSEK